MWQPADGGRTGPEWEGGWGRRGLHHTWHTDGVRAGGTLANQGESQLSSYLSMFAALHRTEEACMCVCVCGQGLEKEDPGLI